MRSNCTHVTPIRCLAARVSAGIRPVQTNRHPRAAQFHRTANSMIYRAGKFRIVHNHVRQVLAGLYR